MIYKTDMTDMDNTAKRGGYESLVVYWIAVTIYDLTVIFCETYMSYKTNKTYTRTYDQMIQAARSGKQNIVEGSLEKSMEGNIKLTGVARASYGELLEDYRDFLRQRTLKIWDKDDSRVWRIRKTKDLPSMSYKTNKTYMTYTEKEEDYGNLMITLCFKQGFLLDRLLKSQQEKFIREGGFRENLFRKRIEYRNKNKTDMTYMTNKGYMNKS